MTEFAKRERTPYLSLVPKRFDANLRFRKELVLQGASSTSAAQELSIMCSRDLLFFVNAFVWTYDPRLPTPTIPMITYPFQDNGMLEIDNAIVQGHDIGIEKSRDMGVSWMILIVLLHRWLFRDYQSFLLASRKASLVDAKGDPKCLFWKLDYMLKNLPAFLRPPVRQEKDRTLMHLFNPDNNSVFNGEYTTTDIARGDRRTAIMLDEFAYMDNAEMVDAATADATNCRIINSTHSGTGHLFYRMREILPFLRMHWSEHPEKAKGLYFRDGKPRSPWYDAECRRRAHPQIVAQELDIDPIGANFPYFPMAAVNKLKEKHGRPPEVVGELEFDRKTLEPTGFAETEKGRLRLWINPGADGMIPQAGEFAVACDVSLGTGASNSTISIGNRRTGEKIGEFVYPGPDYPPSAHAQMAVALCKFFNDAMLIWEANGPGHNFWTEIRRIGYAKYYLKEDEKLPWKKQYDQPGYHTNKLRDLLEPYKDALVAEKFVNHSVEAMTECQNFIHVQGTARVEHTGATGFDPSGARENHGDRVVADALLWILMKESVGLPKQLQNPPIPAGCLAERMALAATEATRKSYW